MSIDDRLGPMGFRAGFIVGLRQSWRLPPWPHLIQFETQAYFEDGKKAGLTVTKPPENVAEFLASANDTSIMQAVMERAWRNVK